MERILEGISKLPVLALRFFQWVNIRKKLARRRGGAEISAETSEKDIGTQVLRAAIGVHREFWRGLLEAVYEVILARELSDLGLKNNTLRLRASAGESPNENSEEPRFSIKKPDRRGGMKLTGRVKIYEAN